MSVRLHFPDPQDDECFVPDKDNVADPLLCPADKMKRSYNFVTEKK